MTSHEYEHLLRRFKEAHEFDQRFNADVIFTASGAVPGLDEGVFHTGASPHILGPLTIRRTAGTVTYRAVWLSARSLDPINQELRADFLDLCRDAGRLIPPTVIKRYGLPDEIDFGLLWLGFILETLRDYRPRFVVHTSVDSEWESDRLVKPFLACAKAIEVAGLNESIDIESDQARIEGDADWKPGKWYESEYGLKPNTMIQAVKRGDLVAKKNFKATRNLYRVGDVRQLWPELIH